jgi:hypothetical protein
METDKMSDVIFNKSPTLKYYYIKPILYTLTGMNPVITNEISNDWVILPKKQPSVLEVFLQK